MRGQPVMTYKALVTKKLREENARLLNERNIAQVRADQLEGEADYLFALLLDAEAENCELRQENVRQAETAEAIFASYEHALVKAEIENATLQGMAAGLLADEVERLLKADEQKRQQAEYHDRALALMRRAYREPVEPDDYGYAGAFPEEFYAPEETVPVDDLRRLVEYVVDTGDTVIVSFDDDKGNHVVDAFGVLDGNGAIPRDVILQ